MKRKLIFLIGKSGSGKDTAADYLCRTYGYHKVASYTTRPMREGEEQGYEHTFLHWGAVAHSPETWLAHRGLHLLAQTYYGGHYYFTAREQLTHSFGKKAMRPLHPHTPVLYIIDEAGLLDMLAKPTLLAWLQDNFNYELWQIVRNGTFEDKQRADRDSERQPLPEHFYSHTICNFYDLDYLYSALDSLAQAK